MAPGGQPRAPLRHGGSSVSQQLLTVEGVSKGFPGVQALRDVGLDLDAGEVHAVVGENGAGKST
ncbi:MAG TPA: ATP-binding cassette domain-containing protein, partial [Euzebya sp.]|nr:ATP-binding cassette domain-containing protein [Euzebya sp.]